jgi:alpha-glucoside transport system substrate-binding protein
MSMRRNASARWRIRAVSAVIATATFAAIALGFVALSSSGAANSSPRTHKIGGSVSVWAEWQSAEQVYFKKAIQPFEQATGITVNYAGKGSNMVTALDAAVAGGKPPDVAFVPSPGALQTLASEGKLTNLGPIVGSESKNYSAGWNALATYHNKLYGVWYKAANKNTIWYNPAEFAAAGITSPPTTWEGLLADATTLKAAGITPFSLCTDIGWPVADFWQNIYLKTAGAKDYQLLAQHKLHWTDPTVTTAFDTLAQLVGQPSLLLGGTQGSLANKYPDCVDKVFPKPGTMPQAAMVFEGDFVVGEVVANSSNYNPGTTGKGGAKCTVDPAATPCYDFFAFPAPSADQANASSVQAAGDVGMVLKPTKQAKAFIQYMASAKPGEIWAKIGGFTSPNNKVPLSSYPDAVTRADAQQLATAKSSVFSLDDEQGSWEPMLWADMLNFVTTPTASNIASVEATMEAQATAAMKG